MATCAIYGKASFCAGTSSSVVIISAAPCEGWLHPISPAAVRVLRRLISADARGIVARSLNASETGALHRDIERTLGVRLRHLGSDRVALARPVALCDQRNNRSEAA